jgi:hypothetical protein
MQFAVSNMPPNVNPLRLVHRTTSYPQISLLKNLLLLQYMVQKSQPVWSFLHVISGSRLPVGGISLLHEGVRIRAFRCP